MLGLNNALYCSHLELKFKLVEMMLESAHITLLKNDHVPEFQLVKIENAAELLRWVYDIVVLDPNKNISKKISVKVTEYFTLYFLAASTIKNIEITRILTE